MTAALRRFDALLEKVEIFILNLVFLTLIVLMTTSIIQRNFTDQSSQAALEYMPTLVVWLSLFGASIGLRRGKHIRMELSLRFLPKGAQALLHRLGGLFGATVMIIGLFLSLDFVANEVKIFGSKGYTASIIPIFFVTATFRYLMHTICGRPAPTGAHP